ncbi:MAG: hypothetical protein QM528_01720 [Phycisphaerales bacterium]|nr:hypothetical protein [Phycisphaerales bacterium]
MKNKSMYYGSILTRYELKAVNGAKVSESVCRNGSQCTSACASLQYKCTYDYSGSTTKILCLNDGTGLFCCFLRCYDSSGSQRSYGFC